MNQTRRMLAAMICFVAVMVARAAEPILVTDYGAYNVGENIVVGFTNGPANAKDWIGIYAEGVIPDTGVPNSGFLYTDGTTTGSAGKAEGTVTFTGGITTPGNYVVYFFENDGYRILSQQNINVVDSTSTLLRTTKRFFALGEPIVANFVRGPGNAKDWIGVYHKGVLPVPGSNAYRYGDDTSTGEVGKTEGTVNIPGISIPGDWVAYFLPNDDYLPAAQVEFTILPTTTGLVSLQSDHDHYSRGQAAVFTFEGGPGNPTDWIGAYRPGQQPGGNNIFSADWAYVGGTQDVGAGISSGQVTFGQGLAVGEWSTFFLLNDGYTIASREVPFKVVEDFDPIIQTTKRLYNLNEPISVNFTNAPGNAKDWVGLYKKGGIPGSVDSTEFLYTDGTDTGTAGITQGTLTFTDGLPAGDYVAYLLENDGYTVLSSESFSVAAVGPQPARIVSMSPANNATNVSASPELRAFLENRDTTVVQNSVEVRLDNQLVPHQIAVNGSQLTVTASTISLFAENSSHTYSIRFTDSAGAATSVTNSFTIGPVITITLPTALFLETFDSTAEGSVPAGWTVSNQSDQSPIDANPEHLGSSFYENFTVVNVSRLSGDFWGYSEDPTVEAKTTGPLAQILSLGKASYVVNGSLVRNFASGKILLGVSGYHGGSREVLEAITPDYNLTGKSDIYLSFHSLLQQNQDSIEGIEVSTDGGATWSPVVYYLDPPDIISTEGVIDFDQTFNTVRGDVAQLPEALNPGTYGSFLKAPIDAQAAAHIQPRIDNDPSDGTRVELIRVPQADNKAAVRFRIFYAGTDSWYFGLDNLGIYSIASAPSLSIARSQAGVITISWPDSPGYVLQSSTTLEANSWSNVPNVTGNTYTAPGAGTATFYKLTKP